MGEVNHKLFVLPRKKAEEGDFEPRLLGGSTSNQWRQLEVVTNKDKLVRES